MEYFTFDRTHLHRMQKISYTFIILTLLIFLISCDEKKKIADKMAQQWCSCNQDIAPFIDRLETVNSAGQRKNILDSIELIVIDYVDCMGGESKWAETDKRMTDKEKKALINSFNTIREETCPEVFNAISKMEQMLEKQDTIE